MYKTLEDINKTFIAKLLLLCKRLIFFIFIVEIHSEEKCFAMQYLFLMENKSMQPF